MDQFDAPSLTKVPKERHGIPHYYGDYVRRIFMVAGIIMLITLPVLSGEFSFQVIFSTFAILLLAFFAGLTNPKQPWAAYLNGFASLVGLVVFEIFSVNAYAVGGFFSVIFFVNQILALLFFFAAYYSSKTLRGMLVK